MAKNVSFHEMNFEIQDPVTTGSIRLTWESPSTAPTAEDVARICDLVKEKFAEGQSEEKPSGLKGEEAQWQVSLQKMGQKEFEKARASEEAQKRGKKRPDLGTVLGLSRKRA